MFWHIVRFDFTGLDATVRAELEDRLRGLADIPEVAWLRLSHDVADHHVTGFLTAFASADDYETYRDHPEHVPVVAAIREAGVAATRFDILTNDNVADLP